MSKRVRGNFCSAVALSIACSGFVDYWGVARGVTAALCGLFKHSVEQFLVGTGEDSDTKSRPRPYNK